MSKKEAIKYIKVKQPLLACRFHPINWWHTVGCDHMEWTPNQLENAYKNCVGNPKLKNLLKQKYKEAHQKLLGLRKELLS